MSNSSYKMLLQGIMIVVFIVLEWILVLMNTTTTIPCWCVSEMELTIPKLNISERGAGSVCQTSIWIVIMMLNCSVSTWFVRGSALNVLSKWLSYVFSLCFPDCNRTVFPFLVNFITCIMKLNTFFGDRVWDSQHQTKCPVAY